MVLAVTGGIGAGKSTFCRMLKRHGGVAHVDADRIVRGLLCASPDVGREIAGRFGEEMLGPGGRVDRRRLARRVFTDVRALRRLEALLHPLVQERLVRKVEALKRVGGVAIVLAEIPLLVEAGVPSWCDLVITVEAGEAARVSRLERRGVDPAEARRRMARQTGDAERRRAADLVVPNDGDLEVLEKCARRLWERLFSRENGGLGRDES